MADIRVPEDLSAWMLQRNWGQHHDQWHFERRWDYWNALLEIPTVPEPFKDWIRGKFEHASENNWKRAEIQEGEEGNGEDFLFMHRAMIELLIKNFPQHLHFFRGWETPPTDHEDELDPVPVPDPEPNRECAAQRKEICNDMLGAITRIEQEYASFTNDDDFGLFVQTNMRPTSDNPLARSSDSQTGIHNYLHGRWSGISEELDLGNPIVNIYNTRFWRLHGWIDFQWWKFRAVKGLSNSDPEYQVKLSFFKNMMDMTSHHHEFAGVLRSMRRLKSENVFADVLSELA